MLAQGEIIFLNCAYSKTTLTQQKKNVQAKYKAVCLWPCVQLQLSFSCQNRSKMLSLINSIHQVSCYSENHLHYSY